MTLDETRKEIARVKRNRRRAAIACACAMAMSAAAAVWAMAGILPLRGQWEYENRRECRTLAQVDEPAYLYVVIKYEGQAPEGVEITGDGGSRLRDMDVVHDEEAKAMAIGAEVGPDNTGQEYAISLVPADNYELQYSVEVQPSYKHITASAEFYEDAEGNLWFYCEASYKRGIDPDGIRVNLRFDGTSYAPTVYDGKIPDGGSVAVNVTEAAAWKRVDMAKSVSAELTLSASYEDPMDSEVEFVNEKYRVLLREWPGYDPDAERDYGMDATWDYIRGLNLRAPEGHELPALPEEDVPGAESPDGGAPENDNAQAPQEEQDT